MSQHRSDDEPLAQAAAYLRENVELRAAVGAPGGEVLQPRRLGEGEHNLNYRFAVPSSGREYVLRVNVTMQPFHDNQVAYEYAALQALAPSGCTPLPVYLDDSPGALEKGVLVETLCEGEELDFDNLAPGHLECAVRLMANVHAVPVSADCPLHRPHDPLRELYAECLQRYELYRTSAFEEPRITRWVERYIAAVESRLREAAPLPGDCTHIVNTEPLPSHFLVPARFAETPRCARDDDGGIRGGSDAARGGSDVARVGSDATRGGAGVQGDDGGTGAFIDWERPIVGEVAQDLAYFTAPSATFWDSEYLMPRHVADDLVEEYWCAVGDRFPRGNFDERYRLYCAVTALRNITWCCRALTYYGHSAVHQTGKAAEKLPIYLSDDFLAFIADECLFR